MRCPIDESTLESYSVDGIVVEKCPECEGLWFEKEQLRLAKDAEGVDLAWLDFDLWSDHDAFETVWSSRNCPVCSQRMAAIIYGDTGVSIDYCVKEHGVWLDKGEFENIIDSLNEELVALDLPDYIAVSLEEAKALVSGDNGRIHEWKDLRFIIRLMEYKVLADNPRLRDALIALGSHPF
jgi:Zn-finger nucleic acid-binding protein